jgi:hypothetical protein
MVAGGAVDEPCRIRGTDDGDAAVEASIAGWTAMTLLTLRRAGGRRRSRLHAPTHSNDRRTMPHPARSPHRLRALTFALIAAAAIAVVWSSQAQAATHFYTLENAQTGKALRWTAFGGPVHEVAKDPEDMRQQWTRTFTGSFNQLRNRLTGECILGTASGEFAGLRSGSCVGQGARARWRYGTGLAGGSMRLVNEQTRQQISSAATLCFFGPCLEAGLWPESVPLDNDVLRWRITFAVTVP